ncbi:MAG: addiction module protein [Gemmatimonadota bacterium]
MSKDEIKAEALKLTIDEREELVQALLASLSPLDYEAEWSAEAERRLTEIESGAVEPISGDVVMERLKKRYS